MESYRKLLVPVDGSESSRNAFRQAAILAQKEKSWITVITVIPPYDAKFDAGSVRDLVENALRQEGEKIIASIQKMADEEGLLIKTDIFVGNPPDVIVDLSEKNGFDLIVLGRRGRTRLQRALMGGVTSRVIGLGKKDVLVVPDKMAIGWKTVLLPVDGSKRSEMALSSAIRFVKGQGGRLIAVSVVDVTEEFLSEAPAAVETMQKKAREIVEKVKEKAEAQGVEADAVVGEGESFRVITDTARKRKADLIIMASHGRRGLRKVFMGSVTEKVIGYAPCPVLVVKQVTSKI